MRPSSNLRSDRSTPALLPSVSGASPREAGEPDGESTNEIGCRSPQLEMGGEEDEGIVDRLQTKRLAEWILAYLAVAWVASWLGDAVGRIWSWPIGLRSGIAMALALGTLPVAVIAWHHGERGEQKVSGMEVVIVGALIVGSAWLVWIVCA